MRSWTVLVALAASTFLYVTIETLPIGLLPEIAANLGTTTEAVGLLVTAYGLMVVAATIPLTLLTHRWRRRRLLVTLLLAATAATALSALAPNYPALLAGRVVTALSQALFWAVVTPAAAGMFRPAVRGRAISILYGGSSVGPLLGVPAGTWLGQQFGWRVPFLVIAGLGLAISAVIVTLMPDQPPGSSDTERGSAPDARGYHNLVVLVAVMVTGGFTAFTCISPFLTEASGLSGPAVGAVLLARGVAGLLGVIAAGFVPARHTGRAMTVVIGVQAVALGTQWAGSAIPAISIAAVAAAGFALSAMTAILAVRVLELAPGRTDTAAAGSSTAFNVGITAGALIGSQVLAGGSVRVSALLGAGITVVALAVSLRGNERSTVSIGSAPH
ncbi:putative MFS family arabinose efflux permease [Actinoplanes tereljensis]|uniref:MFS transporter n=1 Tax=Paractinoplanes tereljensis TaxID=571912 RepID=A0A919NME4_9ACTN|nr:MFS transporter [Actinoplanes tereljensis]GIF21460.1 MFS transporter [Actinoplanes tereljensis]